MDRPKLEEVEVRLLKLEVRLLKLEEVEERLLKLEEAKREDRQPRSIEDRGPPNVVSDAVDVNLADEVAAISDPTPQQFDQDTQPDPCYILPPETPEVPLQVLLRQFWDSEWARIQSKY